METKINPRCQIYETGNDHLKEGCHKDGEEPEERRCSWRRIVGCDGHGNIGPFLATIPDAAKEPLNEKSTVKGLFEIVKQHRANIEARIKNPYAFDPSTVDYKGVDEELSDLINQWYLNKIKPVTEVYEKFKHTDKNIMDVNGNDHPLQRVCKDLWIAIKEVCHININ